MTSPSTTNHGPSLLHAANRSNLAGQLAISIRREEQGAELKRVPVPPAFMRDFHQELLMKHALRRGMPAATLDDMTIELTPVYNERGARSLCRGLNATIVNPQGERFEQVYNIQLFSDVASRAMADLVAEGVMKLDDDIHYELVVADHTAVKQPPTPAGLSFGAGPTQEPLRYLTRELRPLIEGATAVDAPNDDHFPVIYTADAYDRAERFARLGGDMQPPRETGAVLIGTPCSCPATGEFFVVITEALQATDAEEEKISLSYTGKTWLSLTAILKSMQAQEATRSYRFLGQAHGHNFVPMDGAPPCEMCATAKVCSRTSVFVSVDDRTWTQAVFAGAPYALCHIFGLNARHDRVHGLYSLHENRLARRGFYIIPDFDPIGTTAASS